MAYVDRLDVASATVAELMIADSAVRTDADARVVALGDLGVAQSCIVSGGTLQALAATHNGLIDGAKIYDGQLIVRSAGNSGKNWDVYGGAAHVQQGAAVTNVNVYDGGTLYQSRGTIENATIYSGGKSLKNGDGQIVWKNLDVKAGGSVVLLHGCVIEGNINIEEGSYIYQGTTDNRDADVYAVNGVIYNLNQASGIYYSSGITLSNGTVNYGATAIFYSSAAVSDTIDSGTIYISSGAVGRNVRMEGPAAVRYNVYKAARLTTRSSAAAPCI